jgi:hypothetical protein
MIGFFTVVLLVCGLFYGYSLWKICRAFRGRVWLKATMTAMIAPLVAMPFVGMWLERAGYFNLSWPVATIGYMCLVTAGWFFGLSLVTDLWNALVRLIGWATRKPFLRRALLPPGWTVIGIAGVVAVALVVGVINAFNVQQREVVIPVSRLPEGRTELVVAQVSDLHLGLNERGARMRQVIDILERVKPDVIVFTGDIIDSPLAHVDPFADAFTPLKPPLGKYAVLGNHEFYVASTDSLAGVENWYKRAGFRLLRQEAVRPVTGLLVAGVDDPARFAYETLHSEQAALAGARQDELVLFLKHQPVIEYPGSIRNPGKPYYVDEYWKGDTMVQFSGHTHGGQIWPWHVVTALQYPMLHGLYKVPVPLTASFTPGRYVYTNPGAGTWGPPVRLFANPEVTVVRFRKTM